MSSSSTRHHSTFERTPEQGFAIRVATRLDQVEVAVQDVFEYAQRRAQQLAGNGGDPEYFLSLIFDRGAFIHPMSRRPSLSSLGSENESSGPQHAKLQREFFQEFNSLTTENRRFLSQFLQDNDWRQSSLAVRSAPSHRAADAKILLDTVKGLLLLLKCRCGVDGFFCVARNNEEYYLHEDWFFTDPEIHSYLVASVESWDATEISSRLETYSLFSAPNRYAAWIKGEIEGTINMLLAQATGRKQATMNYDNYEKAILIDLGITLVGWTHPMFCCPSDLPLDIQPLEKLLCAVKNGGCYFRRITEAARARHLHKYMQRLREGSPPCKKARLSSEDIDDERWGSRNVEDIEMYQGPASHA